MALVLKDRISETTSTSGTGAITLAGATSGFVAFSTIGNGNTTYYCITDGGAWEVGLGTYTSSGNTLARTTVYSNSNGNTTPITLSGGIKNVFGVLPADGIITVSGTSIQVPGTAVLSVANGGTGSNTATFSGSNITSLNASNISSGTVGTAYLASGTANSTTYLRGDQTWATVSAGGATGVSGQIFTSNGTFTIPSGVTALKVTVVGAGGSGAKSSDFGGSGGGAGGAAIKYLTGLTPGNTLSVTIGTGGAARTTNVAGAAGGNSSVASGTQSITTIQGNGGSGGLITTSAGFNPGAAGGAASGGDVNITGSGGAGAYYQIINCNLIRISGQGGSSIFPSAGQDVNPANSQTGSGGTGTVSTTSGAGGNGIVVFEW